MRRRDFLRSLGAAGAVLAVPGLATKARAQSAAYAGPLLLTIQAMGGWDPTMFCDGKVANSGLQLPYAQPTKVGAFTCAPLSLAVGSTVLDKVPQFFSEIGPRLLVVNGIDTQTNGHLTGREHVWSGRSSGDRPSLAALFAACKLGPLKLPLRYMTAGGGYVQSGGIVQMAPLSSNAVLSSLASPNSFGSVAYHDAETYGRIQKAIAARLARATSEASLPGDAANLAGLADARAGGAGLREFASALPGAPVTIEAAFPNLKGYTDARLTRWLQTVQTILQGFASGVAISGNFTTEGTFDTHADHDVKHAAELGLLFLLLRYVFQLSDQLGLSDRLYVVVGSDFGRTPTYNAGKGKDHWSVTSMMIAGPGIRGGRVIGATDEGLRPLPVDPHDPSKVLAYDDSAGVRLLPEHIHRAFRRLVGIDASPLATPLAVGTPLDDLFMG